MCNIFDIGPLEHAISPIYLVLHGHLHGHVFVVRTYFQALHTVHFNFHGLQVFTIFAVDCDITSHTHCLSGLASCVC